MRRSKLQLRKSPRCELMESRINCTFWVNNTMDYDPTLYDKTDPDTYKVGSFRYAIQEAIEAGGGTIEFKTDVDLDPGSGKTYFGDPINSFNTILLPKGEISIKPALDAVASTN